MIASCCVGVLIVSVIYLTSEISALDGPSLLDDLLVPFEFQPENHIRRIRSLQNPKYNYTYEVYSSNLTALPTMTTRYFVSDVVDPEYFYKKVKAYGHMTTVFNPLRSLSILEPLKVGGCSKNITVTVEASTKQKNCYVAQNGGFFNTKTGSCLGNIVSDGRTVQIVDRIQNANFGITEKGSIVVGYLSAGDIELLKFKQLIGGAIWLVRNGETYVEESFRCESADIQETGSLRTFIDVQSARTAIGHDSFGHVVLVNVEGQTGSRGVNLKEFSKLLIDEFHLVNAINLDGGGSATLVINGTLASYPSDHCKENPEWRCARAVTTIVCVHDLECDEECIHGDCVQGSCVCHENYRGTTCDILYCHRHNCSQHGTCTPDGCVCAPGWHGGDCTAPCGSKFFGENCTQECRCQNNASCDSVNGSCSCLPGFEGALCEKACPIGRYGRHCKHVCHCEETCYCDATSGVCTNMTMQNRDYDSNVARCLEEKKIKDRQEKRKEEESISFHWVAIFCTTVGVLAISLSLNVYLLVIRTPDFANGHYCDTKEAGDYIPLRTDEQDSDVPDGQLYDVTSSVNQTTSSTSKTRPYSTRDHRKMRGKRKALDWRAVSRGVATYEETTFISDS